MPAHVLADVGGFPRLVRDVEDQPTRKSRVDLLPAIGEMGQERPHAARRPQAAGLLSNWQVFRLGRRPDQPLWRRLGYRRLRLEAVTIALGESAMATDFTPHQQKIVERYYSNQGTMQAQRLAELVTEHYSAGHRKRPTS